MEFRALLRPFLPDLPQAAYELVLVRSDGDRRFDARLAILSGTDALDLSLACSSIVFDPPREV